MSTINFHNIDCMEFMRNIPDKYYNLSIIDPPYEIQEDGSKNKSRGKLAKSKDYKPYDGGITKHHHKIFLMSYFA